MDISRKAPDAVGPSEKHAEAVNPVGDEKVANVRGDTGSNALSALDTTRPTVVSNERLTELFGDKYDPRYPHGFVRLLHNLHYAKGADYGTDGEVMVGEGVTVDGKKCLVAYRVSGRNPRLREPSRSGHYTFFTVEVQD
ncbi:hypothetical protein M0P48_01140 [Candidatus Gracilibacteria bacterium]|jgi:hypothetical protein|nr:hypothetical protein [Candidatus Gracilibacteria bacterium]